MPQEAGGIDKSNVVHQMAIWKDAVATELKCQAEWEENWGFLKAPRRMPRHLAGTASSAPSTGKEGKGGMAKSASAPTLQGAGRMTLGPNGERDEDLERVMMVDRNRVLYRSRLPPRERFARPVTTTMEMGWRPTLEKFGVSHHGIQRNHELWPEF
eukprot:gnl/TRDRNA2_/TRDRNA2_59359_c0_seq1.p2 gnl/TRDRNA2_/TRDRNA2_59359_c0~~gnl/TRDRNA2_/TRDRNA2_59359_c0_seq1.p2  ORF type:complete len:156 (+),score=23.47 gnl/TRDRNA2_/TRDRNA2_59359_c0_seq1:83-550(+)